LRGANDEALKLNADAINFSLSLIHFALRNLQVRHPRSCFETRELGIGFGEIGFGLTQSEVARSELFAADGAGSDECASAIEKVGVAIDHDLRGGDTCASGRQIFAARAGAETFEASLGGIESALRGDELRGKLAIVLREERIACAHHATCGDKDLLDDTR
jgi:hypothetical protein